MSDSKLLFMAVAGATFVMGTGAIAPAQAASLDFSFTTVNGATGTFTLDTDATPSPDPANFGVNPITRLPITGLSYPNAVSNLFLSSAPQQLNLSGESADFEIAPTLDSDLIGVLDGEGVISGGVFPAGCSREIRFRCLFTLSVGYTGNLSQLPQLSDDPTSYPSGLSIDFFEPTTAQLVNRDRITNLQTRQRVPEPQSGLSILAFSILLNAHFLLKRNLEHKGVQLR